MNEHPAATPIKPPRWPHARAWRRPGLIARFGLAMALLFPLLLSAAMTDDREITEIRLERTPCFGTCPVDEVILRPDGTAIYIGKQFTKRTGRYEGTFSQAEFARLAKLLDKMGYFAMDDRYTITVTDLPSVVTSVKRSGKTKSVENYGNAGPLELWAIERSIQGVVSEVKWKDQD